jgi:ribose-phosphate pyrophosphokinase
LICPYLPYARQDRVANHGEALSVAVMTEIINGLEFESVEVWDVHSDVSLALLNRVSNITPDHWLKRLDLNWNNFVLVSPDAGSRKKVQRLSKLFNVPVIYADKTRDTQTGEINGTVVHLDQVVDIHGVTGYKNYLIVDDICDGGRTFIDLAKELRKFTFGEIRLYVTHGIFSKGLDVFNDIIDKIYCPNSWLAIKDHSILEVL